MTALIDFRVESVGFQRKWTSPGLFQGRIRLEMLGNLIARRVSLPIP